MRVKKNNSDAVIITGINIPVLVSFVNNYERMPWNELLDKIISDGKKGILIKK